MKRYIFLTIVLSLLIASACSTNNSEESFPTSALQTWATNSNTDVTEDSNEFKIVMTPIDENGVIRFCGNLNEKVYVDTVVNIPEGNMVRVLDVQVVSYDIENIKQILFPEGKAVVEFSEPGYTLLRESLNNRLCSHVDYVNSSQVLYSCRTEQMYEIMGLLFNSDKSSSLYNLGAFSQDIELSFLTREEAIAQVKKTVSQFHIESDFTTTIFTIDHETLSQIENKYMNDGFHQEFSFKGSWELSDDRYYIVLEQVIHGLPVYSDHIDTGSFSYEGCAIEAMITRDGYETLSIKNQYIVSGVNSDPRAILSAEDIIHKVGNKFDSIISNSSFYINSMELKYLPEFKDSSMVSIQLIPVWCVNVTETVETGEIVNTISRDYLMDAFTGYKY